MSERVRPATQALLRFFEYSHPPTKLARVSRPFYGLARDLVANETLDGPELTVALRKLLEAKDAAVRAAL